MKIGIISINMYSKQLNFACPLHTWAFQQFLKTNNIDSTVIDYTPIYHNKNFDLRHPSDSYKERYERLLEKKERQEQQGLPVDDLQAELDNVRMQIENYQALYKEREIRYDKFQKFIDENYIKTETCYDAKMLETEDPGFDCYICVTDVIWRVIKNKGFDRVFFLDSKVMEGKYKIAYSASRGVFHGYTEKQQKEFLRMIEGIDEISVREESLENWIHENSKKEAVTVLDPVLLHDEEFWKKVAVEPEEKGYVLLYYVMEKAKDTIQNAVEYAREHNLDIVELSDRPFSQHVEGVRHIVHYDIGPEEWLGYIQHAECIFTNSFHACCFSILFKKLFYVGNRNGDKVSHILKTFDLTSQRLGQEQGIKDMPTQIDYDKVMMILEEKRQKSKDFILSAIHNAEEHTKVRKLKEKADRRKADEAKKQIRYPIRYHSGRGEGDLTGSFAGGTLEYLKSGAVEYFVNSVRMPNDGTACLEKNHYYRTYSKFIGWHIRIRSGKQWYWYMKDGTLAKRDNYEGNFDKDRMLFPNESTLPHFPVSPINVAVAEAVWKEDTKHKICRLGKKKLKKIFRIK